MLYYFLTVHFGEMPKMTEAKITIHILNWLEANDWSVICYDFPQSGTGILIHPNSTIRVTKNKGGIIPDIIAIKSDKAVFFENKDRYFPADFEKIRMIKLEGNYSEGLFKLLQPYHITTIYYGVGIPNNAKSIQKSIANIKDIDFLIGVDDKGAIHIHIDKSTIF